MKIEKNKKEKKKKMKIGGGSSHPLGQNGVAILAGLRWLNHP
jgi:hypothetical protein